MLSNFQELLNNDLEYQQLLDDCIQELNTQFTQFQHQSIPIIQENYIIRNQTLSRCYSQLNVYRQKLDFASKQVKIQSTKFKDDSCARAVEIGTEYTKQFEKQKNTRQCILDELKAKETFIVNSLKTLKSSAEKHRTYLQNNPLWNQNFNRKGLNFYERTKKIEEKINSVKLDEVEEKCDKYELNHIKIMQEINQIQLLKSETKRLFEEEQEKENNVVINGLIDLKGDQTLEDLIGLDAEKFKQNPNQELRAVQEEESASQNDFEFLNVIADFNK